MIFVDSRAGSKDLLAPLAQMGLPVEETTLDYGDVAFVGRGAKGEQLYIGIEHKKLADLVQSLEGRLPGHQLPGMVQTFDRSWLIVEGDWQHDAQGRTTLFREKGNRRTSVKGAPPAVELEKRLLTLEILGGLHVRLCPTRRDSLRYIYAQYRFWTDKDLDAHRSHLAIHAPDLDKGLMVPMSDFRRILAQVPGIGFRTSGVVEKHFGSFTRMMKAPIAEWAEIATVDDSGKPRRIGVARATKIKEALT